MWLETSKDCVFNTNVKESHVITTDINVGVEEDRPVLPNNLTLFEMNFSAEKKY